MANPNNENFGNKMNGLNHEIKNKVQAQPQDPSLQELAHTAGERVGVMASDFANSTSDYVKTSRVYVQENPVKGVAIAIAAGAIAGSLLTMAMRSNK